MWTMDVFARLHYLWNAVLCGGNSGNFTCLFLTSVPITRWADVVRAILLQTKVMSL